MRAAVLFSLPTCSSSLLKKHAVSPAFGTLFGPFGERFFARYQEQRPLRPGFCDLRRDLYNLYPLLVHATLFGGGYGASAGRIARRLV